MIRAILISPDPHVIERLSAEMDPFPEVSLVEVFPQYPAAADFQRAVRVHAPNVIFLGFDNPEKARELIKLAETLASGIQVVAVQTGCDPVTVRESLRAGVREFLTAPFDRPVVVDCLVNLKNALEQNPSLLSGTNKIFAFLPAKAGAGASTIALNTSYALARLDTKSRVLLSDFDLSSGMLRFLLNLGNEYSVVDAIDHVLKVDESGWSRLVSSISNLDVLHAGPINPSRRISPTEVHNFIESARRNYEALCFDLSGNLEQYSLEIMQGCKRTFVICTPETASLHLAREKLKYLGQLGLAGRIEVLLSRFGKGSALSVDRIEGILEHPVLQVFANSYKAVQDATQDAKPIDPGSELGKGFERFAQRLVDGKATTDEPAKKFQFLNFFSTKSRESAVESNR